MGKARTKKTGYDREVTEGPEGAAWKTDGFRWLYQGGLGLNLRIWHNERWHGLVYAKTLAEAGFFAEGFSAGAQAVARAADMSSEAEREALVQRDRERRSTRANLGSAGLPDPDDVPGHNDGYPE